MAYQTRIFQNGQNFLIGVGALSFAVSFMVFASPKLGVHGFDTGPRFYLLIIGIQSVAYAVSGSQR